MTGKVRKERDERTAEIEVLRVLRGGRPIGSVVPVEMWRASRNVGQQFIFCDPVDEPSFHALPLDLEEEVRFLMQETPTVASLQEAVLRVQGVSVTTCQAGVEFIRKHPQGALQAVTAALDPLIEAPPCGSDWRISWLLAGLFACPEDEATAYALAKVREAASAPRRAVDWQAIPSWPTARGVFLNGVLVQSADRPSLQARIRTVIQDHYPRLEGIALADATYALYNSLPPALERFHQIRSGESLWSIAVKYYKNGAKWQALHDANRDKIPNPQTLTVGELIQIPETEAGGGWAARAGVPTHLVGQGLDRNAYSLGLYQAGFEKARGWQWENARAFLQAALTAATDERLRERIREELRSVDRVTPRKETETRK